jgi:hypothetical protein
MNLRRVACAAQLTLSSCALGDGGAIRLCRGLTHNTSLQRVNLADNHITDASAYAIQDMIVSAARWSHASLFLVLGTVGLVARAAPRSHTPQTQTSFPALDSHPATRADDCCVAAGAGALHAAAGSRPVVE